MAKRLIPLFNRVLVEKIAPPSKSAAGILLPEKINKLNTAKVVAVGPGFHDSNGRLVPTSVKEGETVLIHEHGGTEVKLGEKEYIDNEKLMKQGVDSFHRYLLFRDEDILGTVHE